MLELNSKKTYYVVSRKIDIPPIKIFINGNKFIQRDQFKCLGTLISSASDELNNTEIASRIAQAKKIF